MIKWQRCAQLGACLYQRFFADHIMRSAASLSFSTLLSIVPFLILSVFVLSWVPHFQQMGPVLQQFILKNFVVSATDLNQQLASFVDKMSVLKWTNIVALSITSVLLLINMVDAFNSVWRVQYRFHFAWTFLIYWLVALLLPIAFACLLFLGPYILSIKFFLGFAFFHTVTQWLIKCLPFFASSLVFTLCNWLLPSTQVKLKQAVIAGVFSAIVFSCAKYGFGWYLHFFRSYQLIYGALAAVPFFLVWVYIAWIIVLIGAVLCHQLSEGDSASN